MFHHLELPEKEKTLHDTRRVLVGGGSLHLLDLGGADAGSDGFIARLLHRTARLRDKVEDRILTLIAPLAPHRLLEGRFPARPLPSGVEVAPPQLA